MSEPIIPLLILPHESYESCHTVDGRHGIMDYVYSDVRTDHPIVDPPSIDGRNESLDSDYPDARTDHSIVDPLS
ncbi:hypothetical protein J6590_074212 [Homalodisca vitripennis]|nr:hypothetical protein J6590_074212 [Homalodisca vitripennis]